MGLVSDPDIERDGSDAMYRAQVATLGLELYEMPVKRWVVGLDHRPSF